MKILSASGQGNLNEWLRRLETGVRLIEPDFLKRWALQKYLKKQHTPECSLACLSPVPSALALAELGRQAGAMAL